MKSESADVSILAAESSIFSNLTIFKVLAKLTEFRNEKHDTIIVRIIRMSLTYEKSANRIPVHLRQVPLLISFMKSGFLALRISLWSSART